MTRKAGRNPGRASKGSVKEWLPRPSPRPDEHRDARLGASAAAADARSSLASLLQETAQDGEEPDLQVQLGRAQFESAATENDDPVPKRRVKKTE